MGKHSILRSVLLVGSLVLSFTGLSAVATPSLMADANPVVGRLAPGQTTTRFRLEDAKLEVDDALSFGRGIAWSHEGDRIAYFYAGAVWTVPVDRWDQREQAYGVAHYLRPWSLDENFLAWSPDDAMIGVNLRKDRDKEPAERYMGQVDWQRHALSFLAPDQGMGSDWSSEDRIVGYHGHDLAIYDIRSLEWEPLAVPERFANFSLRPTAWAAAQQLVLVGLPELDYSKSEWMHTVFLANLETGQWEPLPVQAFGTTAYLPQPMPSPDGRWISWIEDRFDFEPRTWRIMLYDRTQAQLMEAANNTDNGTFEWESLSWSPDSKRVAFTAMRVKGPDDRKRTMWILHLDESP